MYKYKRRYTLEEKDYLKSILPTLSPRELEVIEGNLWEIWLREQQTPYLDNPNFSWWLFIAARGVGKTLAGVGWCLYEMMQSPTPLLFGVVCPTNRDILDTIITGKSGFLKKSPKDFYPHWDKTHNWLEYPNGHVIMTFSSESPERIRGKNFDRAWMDEVCAYNGFVTGDIESINQVMAATREGKNTKIIVTTTPKNTPWIRNKLEEAKTNPRIIVTTGTSWDNKENLSEEFYENIKDVKSPWARQEYFGELVNMQGQQPIQKEWIQIWPGKKPLPAFQSIIGSFDTAFTEKEINDPTGFICLGIFWDQAANDWSGMLLDHWLKWLTYPSLKAICKHVWKTAYGQSGRNMGKCPDYLLIENRASGQALLPDLVNEDIEVCAAQPQRDKSERLSEISPLIEAKRFWVPGDMNGEEPALWAKPMVDNLVNYPEIEFDDDIDTFSQAMKHLKTQKWLEFTGRYRSRPEPGRRIITSSPAKNPYAQ